MEAAERRSIPQHGEDQAEKRLTVGSRPVDAELVRCGGMTQSAVYNNRTLGPDRLS
jgi:hypothetical protein